MIRPKPWILRITTTDDTWMTFAPNIYASSLFFAEPNREWGPLKHHEETHLVRQIDRGRWRWLWRYITNKAFRLDEEARGWAVEIHETRAIDESRAYTLRLDAIRAFSSSAYRNCAKSPEEAAAVLDYYIGRLTCSTTNS